MDFITLASQIIASIITALVGRMLDKKIDTGFDRMNYCLKYIENQSPKQKVNQHNQIAGSFNNSELNSVNIEQRDYNTQNTKIVYADGSNTSSSNDIGMAIMMI